MSNLNNKHLNNSRIEINNTSQTNDMETSSNINNHDSFRISNSGLSTVNYNYLLKP